MRAAFGNYTYALFTLNRFFDSMQRFGIQYIELWGAAPHFYLEDRSASDAAVLGKLIRSRGMELVCFTPEQCAYPINIASEDAACRKRSIAYFTKAIEYAGCMGSPAVLVTPGQGSRNLPAADAWDRSLEAMGKLAALAQQRGVALYLEHLTRTTTNLIVTVHDMQRYWRALDSTVLLPMIDLDMMGREGEGTGDFLTAFGCTPAHVHITDGMPGGHMVPGDGILPLEHEMEVLQQNGYKGFVTFEVMHERYLHNPDQAIERCLRWFQNANHRD